MSRFSPFIASVIRFSIVFISFVPFHSVRISASLLANRWFCFLVRRTGPATLRRRSGHFKGKHGAEEETNVREE